MLAKAILDIRDKYLATSYKLLYNKQTMPDDLQSAHNKLDKYVMGLYGLSQTASDRDCMIALFKRYRELTNQ